MSWSSIIDQGRVKRILRGTLERGRLAHAYLFTGPEGVGTDATAIELAKVVNCEGSRVEACDACNSCRKFAQLQHPNITLVFPLPVGRNEVSGDPPLAKLSDADIALVQEEIRTKARNPYHSISIPKASGIKINSIREIRRESALTSFEAGMKVFIVFDADLMTDEASNALLKTLEEPQQDTLLILTTSRPDNLLPTIVSRCQHVRFELLPEDAIRQALIERESIDENRARLIARLANGSYARALAYLDPVLFDRRKEAVDFLRVVLYRSRQALVNEIERQTSTYEKADIADLFRLLQDWLREAMLVATGIDAVSMDEDGEALRKFVALYPGLDYASAIGVLDRAISLLSKNVYIPLIYFDLAFQLKQMIHASPTADRTRVQSG
jgi:DNA polymerase-3 subunit delta'